MSVSSENLPRVSGQDLLNCSFPKWYSRFEKQTIKSVIIPLTSDVLAYLRSDDFFLPTRANKNLDELRQPDPPSSSSDSEDEKWPDDDERNDSNKNISFPELEHSIEEAINKYEAVFPKLNWSSPKDARWMIADNRLKCTSLADVFLLLKSSDFVTHDLTEPFKFCYDEKENLTTTIDYVLVLRKWFALQPAKEFRCFVKNNKLFAITQRDCENYYNYIKPISDKIVDDLTRFFDEKIKNKFFSEDFVVDIYRRDEEKLYIIDFNPWGLMTDSLLFDWTELVSLSMKMDENQKVEFRYVESQNGIKANSYSQYAMPKDVADVFRDQDFQKLSEVLASQVKIDDKDSDNDEENKT